MHAFYHERIEDVLKGPATTVTHGTNHKHYKQIKKYLLVTDIDTTSRLKLKASQKHCKHCLGHGHKISSSSDEDIDDYGMT